MLGKRSLESGEDATSKRRKISSPDTMVPVLSQRQEARQMTQTVTDMSASFANITSSLLVWSPSPPPVKATVHFPFVFFNNTNIFIQNVIEGRAALHRWLEECSNSQLLSLEDEDLISDYCLASCKWSQDLLDKFVGVMSYCNEKGGSACNEKCVEKILRFVRRLQDKN